MFDSELAQKLRTGYGGAGHTAALWEDGGVTRRLLRQLLVPALAFVALLSWALSSPVGAGPDDDYHLVSIWCASPTASDMCAPGATPNERLVDRRLVDAACFAQDADVSAACQSWDAGVLVPTDRGNFTGEYPPVYYAVNGLLASSDIQTSAMWMRVLTIVLFLAAAGLTTWLAPARVRDAVTWGWLITSMPLGLSLIGSNNPSTWAVIGVGVAWSSLLAWFETPRGRPGWWGLAVLFTLGVLAAAGSRADAAIYTGLAIALVLVLTFRPTRAWWLRAILPFAAGLVSLAFFLTSGQSSSATTGFSGGASGSGDAGGGAGQGLPPSAYIPAPGTPVGEVLTGGDLFVSNALNVPFLWSGIFGTWGIGWLDTMVPWVVSLAAIAVFVGVVAYGVRVKDGRLLAVVTTTAIVLWVVPVYVLQSGGDLVGEQVQPRYLLPLIVLFAGLALLAPGGRSITIGRVPATVFAASLVVANFVALHIVMQRYIVGIDGVAPLLATGAEWWWGGAPPPDLVWLVGSAAYGAFVLILIGRMRRGAEVLT